MEKKIIEAVKENKLIAIVRGVESEKCVKIAQALYDGGFRLMEITYDQKHPEVWEETAKAIGAVAKAFEGKKTPYLAIPDRREAIRTAVDLTQAGDILVLAGKGHENYQLIGNEKIPFSEREILAGVIRELVSYS